MDKDTPTWRILLWLIWRTLKAGAAEAAGWGIGIYGVSAALRYAAGPDSLVDTTPALMVWLIAVISLRTAVVAVLRPRFGLTPEWLRWKLDLQRAHASRHGHVPDCPRCNPSGQGSAG